MGKKYQRHGMSGTQFYNMWKEAKQRTTNPNNKDYADYGGRGITMCERWMIFANFMEDMYDKYLHAKEFIGDTDTITIERYNNSKGYHPDNVCFVPLREQQMNTRSTKLIPRSVAMIRALHKTGKILQKDLAKLYGVTPSAISLIVNNKLWINEPAEELRTPRGLGTPAKRRKIFEEISSQLKQEAGGNI